MPCQPNCEVHRLNLELQVIKTDKIKTLTELYQVTKDLGRNNRHRRNEVSRIERKLMTTIAERLYIEDEISRGCPACRQSWKPRNKIAPQMTEPQEHPKPRCHLPTTCCSGSAYRSEERDTKKWRCRAAGHLANVPAARCLNVSFSHQWMILHLLHCYTIQFNVLSQKK